MTETKGAEVVGYAAPVVRALGIASRTMLGGGMVAWTGVVVGEWELEHAWFEDRHPHDEINYVLAGELVVTCAGVVHHLRVGDTIRVPGGTAARYAAPVFARLLFVYGPNQSGAPSAVLGSGRGAPPPA